MNGMNAIPATIWPSSPLPLTLIENEQQRSIFSLNEVFPHLSSPWNRYSEIKSLITNVVINLGVGEIPTHKIKTNKLKIKNIFRLENIPEEEIKELTNEAMLVLLTAIVAGMKVEISQYADFAQLLYRYPLLGDVFDVQERWYLINNANSLRLAMLLIPAANNKILLLKIAALLEKSKRTYSTGSGASLHSKRRSMLYEGEGNITAKKRDREYPLKQSNKSQKRIRVLSTVANPSRASPIGASVLSTESADVGFGVNILHPQQSIPVNAHSAATWAVPITTPHQQYFPFKPTMTIANNSVVNSTVVDHHQVSLGPCHDEDETDEEEEDTTSISSLIGDIASFNASSLYEFVHSSEEDTYSSVGNSSYSPSSSINDSEDYDYFRSSRSESLSSLGDDAMMQKPCSREWTAEDNDLRSFLSELVDFD